MNKQQLARRMADIEPFYVMELLARARQLEAAGRHIVHMEVGEPEFSTPETVLRQARLSMEQNPIHYTPAQGLPALREAVSRYYSQRYNLEIPASRIVITPGSSGALQLVLAALVNPGDAVLMADPGYPCNRHFVRLYEGTAIQIPVDQTSHYQLNRKLLEQYWSAQTQAVLVASPSNPTGSVIPSSQLQALYEFTQQQKASLIVDEIYHGLTYGVRPQSALALGDSVFVVNSFSKYFGMTGWRLGWVVAPEWAMDALSRLAQNLYLSAPTLSQYAAMAAFEPETIQLLDDRRDIFQARRDYLVPALKSLGFKIPEAPEGAFYIYADCSAISHDSFSFCHHLLEKAGVAVTPGRDFGVNRASEHIRFAYTADIEQLKAGVQRIQTYLGSGDSALIV